jgi:DNA-binding NarL/FixJ family response regulator
VKPNTPAKILVVDDHYIVRAGLRGLIDQQPDMKVEGEAQNGEEAIRIFKELNPDVTIMDLRIPVISGVDAIRAIYRDHPDARILVLSSFDGDEDIHSALEAGASGYVLKHSSGDQIIPAIRALMSGHRWIPPEIEKHLDARNQGETLTTREREIVGLLAQGEANKQIAGLIGITEETVKSHVKNILAKLKVRDRTEAVTVALRRGIVHLPEV